MTGTIADKEQLLDSCIALVRCQVRLTFAGDRARERSGEHGGKTKAVVLPHHQEEAGHGTGEK